MALLPNGQLQLAWPSLKTALKLRNLSENAKSNSPLKCYPKVTTLHLCLWDAKRYPPLKIALLHVSLRTLHKVLARSVRQIFGRAQNAKSLSTSNTVLKKWLVEFFTEIIKQLQQWKRQSKLKSPKLKLSSLPVVRPKLRHKRCLPQITLQHKIVRYSTTRLVSQ